jgi:hypothetical protein
LASHRRRFAFTVILLRQNAPWLPYPYAGETALRRPARVGRRRSRRGVGGQLGLVEADDTFAHADIKEVKVVARVLVHLAPVVLRPSRERRVKYELLRQFVGGAVTPDPVDIEEAHQRAEIIRSMFAGTTWAPAADLAGITGVTVPAVLDWKKRGRIFAVEFEGKEWYPLYAIGNSNRPIRELARVIQCVG